MYFVKKIFFKTSFKIFAVTIFFSLGFSVYAETSGVSKNSTIFKEFVSINNSFITNKHALFFQHVLDIYQNNNLVEHHEVDDFFYGSDQLLQIIANGKTQIFLSTANGFWAQNSRMRSPLKISGNFKAHGMDVQDIFRIDFKKDYSITNIFTNSVLLKRVNKKMTYVFVKITKTKKSFTLIFMDKNETPIKKIMYFPDKVGDFYCFKTIKVNDLIFHTDKTHVYKIISIKKANVPVSIFTSTNMLKILPYFQRFEQ